MGIPALPLAEDLPVHPAGAGFRFPQRKLFPASELSAAPAGFSRGSVEETLMGEKIPNSFRLPRWEGKRPVWSSWWVEGCQSHPGPIPRTDKAAGSPGKFFLSMCVLQGRAGQGRESATLMPPQPPTSPIRLLPLFSLLGNWLGRRERQLELLQAFPGLPQS